MSSHGRRKGRGGSAGVAGVAGVAGAGGADGQAEVDGMRKRLGLRGESKLSKVGFQQSLVGETCNNFS